MEVTQTISLQDTLQCSMYATYKPQRTLQWTVWLCFSHHSFTDCNSSLYCASVRRSWPFGHEEVTGQNPHECNWCSYQSSHKDFCTTWDGKTTVQRRWPYPDREAARVFALCKATPWRAILTEHLGWLGQSHSTYLLDFFQLMDNDSKVPELPAKFRMPLKDRFCLGTSHWPGQKRGHIDWMYPVSLFLIFSPGLRPAW